MRISSDMFDLQIIPNKVNVKFESIAGQSRGRELYLKIKQIMLLMVFGELQLCGSIFGVPILPVTFCCESGNKMSNLHIALLILY